MGRFIYLQIRIQSKGYNTRIRKEHIRTNTNLTKINQQIREALIEIKGKPKDWGKESVKSLTQKLRGEREVPYIETKLRTENFEGIWEKLINHPKLKKEWSEIIWRRTGPYQQGIG